MAHFNYDSSVNDLFCLKLCVTLIECNKSRLVCFKPVLVNLYLFCIIFNVTSIFRNFRSILFTKFLRIFDSILEVCCCKSKGLCGDKHIGCLSNLKLETIVSEQYIIRLVVELWNLIGKARWVEINSSCFSSGRCDKKRSSESLFHSLVNLVLILSTCSSYSLNNRALKFLTGFHIFRLKSLAI